MARFPTLANGGYTTAPYVLCTYYVPVRVGAALQAMELCLRVPVAGVYVSAGWAGLVRVLGWYSCELSSIPAGLVFQFLAERVILLMAVSSTAIGSWLRTISVAIRCSAACKFLMRLRSTVWSCAMTCRYFRLGLPFHLKRRLLAP